jgi:hypothetical protein
VINWIRRTTGAGNMSDPFVWTRYFLPVSPEEAETHRRYAEQLHQSSWVQRWRRFDARRAVRREAKALAKLVLGMLWEKLLA